MNLRSKLLILLSVSLILCPALAQADTLAEILWPVDTTTLVLNSTHVKMYATCDDFLYHKLFYRSNDSSNYILLDTDYSETEWFNADSYEFECDTLSNGLYWILLEVHSTNGLEAVDSTIVKVSPDNTKFVYKSLSGEYSCIANYCDYDNDREWEIIYPISNDISYFSSDGTTINDGPDFRAGSRAPAAIGNFNDDNIDDIVTMRVVGTTPPSDSLIVYLSNDSVLSINTGLDLVRVWESDYDYHFPIVKEIGNGSSTDEILVLGDRSTSPILKSFYIDSLGVLQENSDSLQNVYAAISTDLDGDGIDSVYYIMGESNYIKVADNTLNYSTRFNVLIDSEGPSDVKSLFSSFDVNGDGNKELIFLAAYDAVTVDNVDYPCGWWIWAIDSDHNTVSGWPFFTGIKEPCFGSDALQPRLPSHPVFADVDDDSEPELFISSFNYKDSTGTDCSAYIYAYNSDGTSLLGDTTALGDTTFIFAEVPFPCAISQPLIADFNGDGELNILTSVTNTLWNKLYQGQSIVVWNKTGDMLSGYPIEVENEPIDSVTIDYMFTPYVLDTDGDGDMNLVLPLVSEDVLLMDMGTVPYIPSEIPVASYRYDRGFTGIGPSFPEYDTTTSYTCGNANNDFAVNMSDVWYILDYAYYGGPSPQPLAAGDVDGVCGANIGDVVRLSKHVTYIENPDSVAKYSLICPCTTSIKARIPEPITMISTYENEFTTLTLNSSIDIAAIEFSFVGDKNLNTISLLPDEFRTIRSAGDFGLKVTLIDLESLQSIEDGQTEILNIPGKTLPHSIVAYDNFGNGYPVQLKGQTDPTLPTEYVLSQNYPNPFNPTTNIKFSLPYAGDVKLEVYNVLGQLVTVLLDKKMEAGYHEVTWEGSAYASGVYFYKLKSNSFTQSKKMILIK